MTTDEAIDDALKGIELARPGVDILEEWSPTVATVARLALTGLYEGLVIVRGLRHNPDELRASLAAQGETFLQNLAASKFGRKDP